MKIEIDLNKLKLQNLTPNQATILYLIYYKEWAMAKALFSKAKALSIRNSLVTTKYILSNSSVNFTDTIISTSNVTKLFGIRSEKINFVDFYLAYPPKVGSRILRAGSIDSVLGRKHYAKYIKKVTTAEAHAQAVKNTTAFVAKQRQVGKMQYLPMMETVLNNALWEQWGEFVDSVGEEGANWNSDSI